MKEAYILATLSFVYYFCSAQIAPHWGEIECDSTVSGQFPPGSTYTSYTRWYTFSASYPTLLRRDIRVSACIEDREDTIEARIPYQTHYTPRYCYQCSSLRSASDPNNANLFQLSNEAESSADNGCGTDEHGVVYTFTDVPEGDWEIGIISVDSSGGRYTLSVECINPSTPAPASLANKNQTKTFDNYSVWKARGNKKISCGISAYGTVDAINDKDYYQYEVTQYAQEIVFTTCDPSTYYDSPTSYDGTSLGNHYVRVWYWNYGTAGNRWWYSKTGGLSSVCGSTSVTLGGSGSTSTDILHLSPGIYYVGIDAWAGATGSYVLSMICWNNAAVKTVTAVQDYTIATFNPTPSPNTASPTPPTTAFPTLATATPAPTEYPTETFGGHFSNTKKQHEMADISCGIHRHDTLDKKQTNWYRFQVDSSLSQYYFDTCMNDITKWDACLQLFKLQNGDWLNWNGPVCSYCNLLSGTNLAQGTYAIEIYGDSDRAENFGEYILRMGCSLDQYNVVPAVTLTDAPTPAPTGVADIPAKDGKVAGDISCDLTVSGTTASRVGDFHKFVVKGGIIDWVRFDTCEATSFMNYLWVYDYFNMTGHETFQRFDSNGAIGFHYEDDTACNEITMHDLPPGTYYVNIDGFNYYFDHGSYTITMTCSDNSKVASATNYEEYKKGLKWWHWLLIALGILLVIVLIVIAVICCKKKKAANSEAGPGSAKEMARVTSNDAPGDDGE